MFVGLGGFRMRHALLLLLLMMALSAFFSTAQGEGGGFSHEQVTGWGVVAVACIRRISHVTSQGAGFRSTWNQPIMIHPTSENIGDELGPVMV